METTLTSKVEDKSPPQSRPYVLPGLGQVTPNSLFIASVHFSEMKSTLRHHGNARYCLRKPDVDSLGEMRPEKVSILTVYDAQQFIPIVIDIEAPPKLSPVPVPVQAICSDLIHQWTRNRVGAAGQFPPGIMQIKRERPDQGEYEKLISLETAHCNALVEEADRYWTTKQGKIQPGHRLALSWLGSARREWFKQIEPGEMKVSAATGNTIPMAALVDGGVNLVDFYLTMSLKPEDYGDDFIANLFRDPKFLSAQRKRLGLEGEGGKK